MCSSTAVRGYMSHTATPALHALPQLYMHSPAMHALPELCMHAPAMHARPELHGPLTSLVEPQTRLPRVAFRLRAIDAITVVCSCGYRCGWMGGYRQGEPSVSSEYSHVRKCFKQTQTPYEPRTSNKARSSSQRLYDRLVYHTSPLQNKRIWSSDINLQ